MHMPLVLTNRRRRGGSASAPAFSPSNLFSTTAIGIWLDPSDLSTMFSDRAGTTPVTTPGTVVGLRLDKSKGLVLGSELVVNGDFASGTTGWASSSGFASSAAVVSGEFQVTTTVSYGRQIQAITCVVGRTYKVACTARVVSGTVTALIERTNSSGFGAGFGPFSSTASTTTTPLSMVFTATNTTEYICVGSGSTGTGQVIAFDNISVRELAGNHAVAPTDAARPTYGVEPKGGRRNLLTWSEDFGNAVWQKGSATITANTDVAPDGTTTADTFTATGSGANLFFAPPAAAQYALSFYVKRGNSDWVACSNASYFVYFDIATGQVGSVGNGTASIVSAGNGWYRCVWLPADTTQNNQFRLRCAVSNGSVSTTTQNAIIWGAQLELGSTATNYQRITTAYDVTESGVATCHYVQYDGSDDSLSTAAIDFTATDKMSVFAGVRKLSDAALAIIVESSAGTSDGRFGLFAPVTAATANYAMSSRGNSTSTTISPSSFAAPISNVLTGLGDISGDTATLRIDGAQVAQSTADQGTGNFGNYPLFIGRRNNTLLPFNGRDFGIIIVGKAASAGEITDTETWLAAKTAQVTL